MATRKRATLGIALIAALAIQFIPVDRSNPPVESESAMTGPAAVQAILRRSCHDCHSHETRWPWYAHVAPVSWLIAHHVHEARGKLDLSEWNRSSERDRAAMIREIWEEVEEGAMPPAYYLVAHRSARLSEADRAELRRWAEAEETGDGEASHEDNGGR